MKQIYLLSISLFITASLHAQTTVQYTQQAANYTAFFTDGGGNYDNGATEFGMWANFDAKQSVAWRNFTEDATTSGNLTTMAIGDSFTITVSATQASFGQIGVALLSSPSSTTSWADRINNYAVQVNLNGNSGANDPWEVVSDGGAVDASSIGGSTSYADFKFIFTLDTATTLTVSINDGAETFNITLNNQDITGYSIYFADDWNGVSNADIFWKPTSEYRYVTTLSTEDFQKSTVTIFVADDEIHLSNMTPNEDYTLSIFDTMGRQVKNVTSNTNILDISELKTALYFLVLETSDGNIVRKKILKY